MCYAVVPINQDPLLSGTTPPSWYVLANACKGQVLKRVEQTTCNSCPTVKILSINTHSMTFSRITGELLVSATRVYRFRESQFNSTANGFRSISLNVSFSLYVTFCRIPTLAVVFAGKNLNSTPSIVEKHSVVVLHALNKVIETLSSIPEQGMHFVWSPDGSRIGWYSVIDIFFVKVYLKTIYEKIPKNIKVKIRDQYI